MVEKNGFVITIKQKTIPSYITKIIKKNYISLYIPKIYIFKAYIIYSKISYLILRYILFHIFIVLEGF